MIKRFLEKCDAAEVRVGEVDVAVGFHRLFANAAPDEVGPRRDHGVAPTHYVYSLGQLVNVGMRTGEVGQADIGEITPAVIEELCAGVLFVTHRVVIGQDRRAVVDAFLMRRRDITKRRTFVQDVVP